MSADTELGAQTLAWVLGALSSKACVLVRRASRSAASKQRTQFSSAVVSGVASAVRTAVSTLHEVHDRLAGLLGFSPLLILFAVGTWYSVRVMYWRWRQREVGRA